jgi:hypothetical protein
LNETAIAGKCAGRGLLINRKDIDAASPVDSLVVGLIPGACVQARNSGHDTIRDIGYGEKLAAVVEDPDPIPCTDLPGFGILGIEP